MFSRCTVCSVSLGPNDIESHVKGKKHKKHLERNQTFGGPNGDKPVIVEANVTPGNTTDPKLAVKLPQQTTKHQKKPKRKREEKQPDAKTDVPDVVVDRSKDFMVQVDGFIKQIEQTELERQKIQRVLRDVAFTFARVMPDVIPVLYGSQLSGLAFRTSDIDVYLCNPRGGEENQEFIKKHGRIIHRTRLFTSIVHITRARVPVIKAKHILTGIDLDISATSGQAVTNSLLLRFILTYDPRIRKLMMLIGYWAKKCNLISTSKFSRYSFNLLIIFYLQSICNPMLPPLSQLILGVPGRTWPFRITEDVSLLRNNNVLPFHQLFINFFEFYCEFNFSNTLISTYLGMSVPITDMEQPHVLDKMVYYKVYLSYGGEKFPKGIVSIQDPLELCRNTSKAVLQKTLTQFQLSCKKMLDMKEKMKKEDWLHEMACGDVAKPVVEKVHREHILKLAYKTSKDWKENFTKDFRKVLMILGIQLGTNLPCADDNKKSKLDPSCLQLSLETTFCPTPECKKLLQLLKEGCINVEVFSKEFDVIRKKIPNQKFQFSAECFVSTSKTDTLDLVFNNTGDVPSFYRVIFVLLKHIKVLMSSVSTSMINSDEDIEKNKPEINKMVCES